MCYFFFNSVGSEVIVQLNGLDVQATTPVSILIEHTWRVLSEYDVTICFIDLHKVHKCLTVFIKCTINNVYLSLHQLTIHISKILI
jgi:hypothetical protein